jgi:hypothetical protein
MRNKISNNNLVNKEDIEGANTFGIKFWLGLIERKY